MVFAKIKDFWNNRGFDIIVIVGIIFIVIYGLIRIIFKKSGTWSTNYYYAPSHQSNSISIPSSDSNDSHGERECRRVLESIFGLPFGKLRPNFLSNPVTGGNNLEIDCYNEDLKIGVEYSGRQHYEFVPYFHKNKEAFLNQKYRDELKRRMCLDNGILLIEVPYTVKVKDIQNYLMKILGNLGYI